LSVGLTQTTFNIDDNHDNDCASPCNGSEGVVGHDLFITTFENIGTEATVNATMNEAEEELEVA